MTDEFYEIRVSQSKVHKILANLRETCDSPDEAFVTLVYALKLLRDTQRAEVADDDFIHTLEVCFKSIRDDVPLQ